MVLVKPLWHHFVKVLQVKIPELTIVKVDVDDCEELASTNDISCMPTLHFYKNGVILNRLEGADKNTFLKLVSDLV